MPAASRTYACRAATAFLTLAVYATGVGMLPALHAGAEVARSDGTIEAAHSDTCPTLHGGALCAAVAGLSTAQAVPTPDPIVSGPEAGHPTLCRVARRPAGAPPLLNSARAPPQV